MPVFKRKKQNENSNAGFLGSGEKNMKKATVVFALGTMFVFALLLVFGLPLLIRFSVFLGESRAKGKVKESMVLPPRPPRIVLSFEATKSATVDISGFAESQVLVDLFSNNQKVTSKKAEKDGSFQFFKVELQPGKNTFYTIATLNESLKSENSREVVITRDDSPPSLELTNPSEDKLKVEIPDFDIVGKTEVGCLVWVNNYSAAVNNKGEFKLKLQLQPGKNDYVVKSVDVAGNETKKNITLTLDI